jgi:hypothetical protein
LQRARRASVQQILSDDAEKYFRYLEAKLTTSTTIRRGRLDWEASIGNAITGIAHVLGMTGGAKFALRMYIILQTNVIYHTEIRSSWKSYVEHVTIAIQGCINKLQYLREYTNPASYELEPPLDYTWACDELRPTLDM